MENDKRTVAEETAAPTIEDSSPVPANRKIAQQAHVTPDPNIVFVGKASSVNEKGETVTTSAEPPTKIRDGREVFDMPDVKSQVKGFYHADAHQIIRAFPQLYKRFQQKGV